MPTIWIINKISLLDNATIRRFDCVMKIAVKKIEHKEQIVRHICGENLNKETLDFILNMKRFAPAIIARAYSVSSMIDKDIALHFKTLVKNTIKAQKPRFDFCLKNPNAKNQINPLCLKAIR